MVRGGVVACSDFSELLFGVVDHVVVTKSTELSVHCTAVPSPKVLGHMGNFIVVLLQHTEGSLFHAVLILVSSFAQSDFIGKRVTALFFGGNKAAIVSTF